jgi:hypothetical protein
MQTPRNQSALAKGLIADIEHCQGCGLVHLNIGALTLRLQLSALHDLRDTLNRAVAALPRHAASPQTPKAPCH